MQLEELLKKVEEITGLKTKFIGNESEILFKKNTKKYVLMTCTNYCVDTLFVTTSPGNKYRWILHGWLHYKNGLKQFGEDVINDKIKESSEYIKINK